MVCESVPTSVSGIATVWPFEPAAARPAPGTRGSPGARCRCRAAPRGSCSKRLLPPAQELVALAVALELDLDVLLEAPAACRSASTCTEWSITRSTGISGLMRRGSPPMRAMASRIAARSTTHGHAGEVLQDHARRHEGNLALRLLLGIPLEDGGDVVGRDGAAVLAPQQVLEQHAQRERQPRRPGPRGRRAGAWRSARRRRRACRGSSCCRGSSP